MSESKKDFMSKFKDNLRNRVSNPNNNNNNNNNNENNKNKTGETKSVSQVNSEYFQELEQWLNNARLYGYSCNFIAGLPLIMMAQHMNGFTNQMTTANNLIPPVPPFGQGMFSFYNQNLQQQQQQQPQQPQQQPLEDGIIYSIPPIWKRFMAEMVDFTLLFFVKLGITFIAVNFFEFVDFEKYNGLQDQIKLDYNVALEITTEILFLEMIHRLIVCVYEGIFLQKSIENQAGGATPGKIFMGIRVLLCHSVQPVENRPNLAKIYPAQDLGIGWSFARAFLKNLVLAMLFPICFPFFFNKFNRTSYDILCHSIVVEDRQQQNRLR